MLSEIATMKHIAKNTNIPVPKCQLLDTSVERIGRLTLDPSGNVDIGPLPAAFGFGGPFILATDYFLSWANQDPKFKHQNMLNMELQHATRSFPKRLRSTIHKLDKYADPGRYPIIHPDFQVQNILFNDEFEVVGVIDWESAYSAPLMQR
ncbi:hypothetical protein N0V84_011562 [Fusarium piperis]|uniref:Aminoglycoside phosphotransferase domain-containing protein n=1 Tax=Fusarium piperis TaxID=1435070 RepID=A0A9W8TAY6_9HYPO|nr:hypothetical protein N0V84_011562 [Fusarium piperis]